MVTPQHHSPVIPFPGRARNAIDLRIEDRAQRAVSLGPARFAISGRVSAEAPARLTASFDSDTRDIALSAGMTPMATFRALEHELPPGFLATARSTASVADADVHVAIHPAHEPAAALPQVVVTLEDPVQTAHTLAVNRFEIRDVATNGGVVQSTARVLVDGHTLHCLITRGMTPLATARAIERRLPKGYRAQVDVAGTLAEPAVVVTIVRGSIIHSAAA